MNGEKVGIGGVGMLGFHYIWVVTCDSTDAGQPRPRVEVGLGADVDVRLCGIIFWGVGDEICRGSVNSCILTQNLSDFDFICD